MDSVKKYMQEKAGEMEVEQIGDQVWKAIELTLPSPSASRWLRQPIILRHLFGGIMLPLLRLKTSRFRLPASYLKPAMVLLLPVLLLLSCAFRIERTETLGRLLIVSLKTKNSASRFQIQALQKRYQFNALFFEPPGQPERASAVSYFSKEEFKKLGFIQKELRQMAGIEYIETDSLTNTINESLFTAFVHRAFNIHVDAKAPNPKKARENLAKLLEQKGATQVEVTLDKHSLFLKPKDVTAVTSSPPGNASDGANGNLDSPHGPVPEAIEPQEVARDSAYILLLKEVGYTSLPQPILYQMKTAGITPAYIREFQQMGYGSIAPTLLIVLKSRDITPGYLKSFQQLADRSISLAEAVEMKTAGMSADFVKDMRKAGFAQLTLRQMTSLKINNITLDLITAYKALGFETISFNELLAAKATQTTPAFIREMKEKGQELKLRQYIELKAKGNR